MLKSVSKAGKTVFYTLTTSAVATAGVSAYAYYDPKFRSTLENELPISKEIFNTIIGPVNSQRNAVEKKQMIIQKPETKSKDTEIVPLFSVPQNEIQSASSLNAEEVTKLIESVVDKKFTSMSEVQKLELSSKLKNVRADFEEELRREVCKVQAAQAAHEEEMLRSQRENLETQHKRNLHDALLKERSQYADGLAMAVAKLEALEFFLNGREEFDTLSRRSKKLWISCQNLRSALTSSTNKTRPLRTTGTQIADVISDIKTAGESDEFVHVILQSLPEEVLSSGVYTDDELVERFSKVKTVSRRLAGLGSDTKPNLFQYFLSYLQSIITIDSVLETYGTTDINISAMSTYDILSRASFCLQRKDFHSALRLMSLLKGESAKVAADWLKDLRMHLETRQLADVLIAHALAQSIRSLY